MMLRDGRCQYCKDSFPPSLLTCDHVVPRAYGGSANGRTRSAPAICACNAKKASLLPSQLKAVGMRLPNPRAPSAYGDFRGPRPGLAVHNLLRKQNVHESWKIHIGAADLNVTMRESRSENEELLRDGRRAAQLARRDRSVAYSR